MKRIRNFDLITSNVIDFDWIKFQNVLEFHFFKVKNKYFDEISVLELTLEYKDEKTYLFKLHFKELGSLKINTSGSGIQLSLFEVTDIREDGWSELNYKVRDYESDEIEFYCKEIEVISITCVR